VPEYPTEEGFSVSDNISLKPESISMTLYVTNTPVTWRNRHGSGPGRVESVVKQLEELYYARKVITVVTSDKVYENMALTSMSISKSADVGYAREIPVTLKKIIVTQSKTVSIPASYGKSGATGASAGTANTTGATKGTSGGSYTAGGSSGGGSGGGSEGGSSERGGSILYNTATAFGLI